MAVSRYVVEVEKGRPGSEGSPSVGPVYRSVFAKDGFAPPLPGVETVWDVFARAVEKYPGNKMLGHRNIVDGKAGEYVWETYKEVYEKVLQIGAAMRHVGVEPKGRAGVYGANSPQWVTAMEACNGHSVYCVPLYDTLGAEAVEFILKHAEIPLVFVQESKIGALLPSLRSCGDLVKTVVSFSEVSEAQRGELEGLGIKGYSWSEFLQLGKENPAELSPPVAGDICTIMYTSGTTGEPKGVRLTNESVVSVIAAGDCLLKNLNLQMTEADVYLSFLPLAHIFDRTMEEQFIYCGASIGFWQGDVKTLLDDLEALKPTFFCGVPRVFDRIYSGATAKVAESGWLRKKIFDFGFKSKLDSLKKGAKQEKASQLFDLLLFKKIKAKFGGRVRLVMSGAAPLAQHVEEFLRVSTCSMVVQGYGLTETCAGSFVSIPDVIGMQGTVGPPLPNIEVRLESVPEMNYDALGAIPRGEICIRGKSLFSGYHKRDDLTKEVLVDGWFHTGDIGEWQPDGALKIIDRKKNIFKLSQGEYVAVENLENVFGLCSDVDSIWVYGNSFESSLVAVVVPNKDALESWAKAHDEAGDFEALCKSPKAKEYILSQLNVVGKKSKLKGFEAIRAVHLDPLPFDLERDLLTPTFKKKRPQLLKCYQSQIDALYAGLKKP